MTPINIAFLPADKGRSIQDLGIEGVDKDTLLRYVRTGKR